MIIGTINNYGEIKGQITDAQYVTGFISSAELMGGQIVGMRGMKGDKGDTGDTGADGQDGADGFSPIANVSKVGDTATITITDSLGTTTATVEDGADGQDGQDGADGHSPVITANKVGKVTTIYADGVAIATINDGQDGGGSTAFIAEYGVTTYADVKDAYDEDAIILCTVDDSGNTAICQLAYFDDANDTFYFAQPMSDGFYVPSIASDDTWDDSYFTFASTDTATELRNGLMSALDWQKLDGIESGAEANVQSDWDEADSTNDAYIKNKPTIPQDKVYIVDYNSASYDDVEDALSDGKVVFASIPNSYGTYDIVPYVDAEYMGFIFAKLTGTPAHPYAYFYRLNDNDTWNFTTKELAKVENIPYVANKSDMTYADVTQALADGKSVIMFDGEFMYAYSSHDTINDYYWFSRIYGHSGFQRWRIDSSDVWTDEGITNFADYVIAQGTSGIWRYRKWNSGVYECFGTYNGSIAVTTTSAGYGGYRSGALSIPTFPITFTETPTVTATVGSGSQGCWVNNVQPTTTGGSYYLSSGASNAATNRSIQFQVMGRWK